MARHNHTSETPPRHATTSRCRRFFPGGEAGQALPMVAICLLLILGCVGLSVDIGRLVWARTSIQAAVDASALAAAQSMPNSSAAQAEADQYWLDNSGFIRSQGQNVSMSVAFPTGNKAITVSAEADIPTWFARLFGVNSWHVSAEGEAQSQVLDIALVLDISGSMCWDTYPKVDNGGWMSPGRAPARLSTPIPAGGPSSIVIRLDSISMFTSTNASTNSAQFGYNTATPYWQYAPGGSRRGLIMIDKELFQITAVNVAANQLTVTRALTNLFLGTPTPATAHPSGAEVWALRSNCLNAGRTASGPYEPFDTTISISQYFTTLFNPSYDKFGVATFATGGATLRGLTGNLAQVRTDMGAVNNPDGSTNSAYGLALGRRILDGAGKRSNAVRVLVFVTDGRANTVCSPTSYSANAYDGGCGSTWGGPDGNATAVAHAINEATRAANGQVIIYTVGLGANVDDSFLQQIAAAGNGQYFKAPTTAQLDDAFRAIAASTHIALTK